MSRSGQKGCQSAVDGSFIEELPNRIIGFLHKTDRKRGENHSPDDVDKPMDSEIDDGKRCEENVAQGHVLESAPSTVMIVLTEGEPYGKRNGDVQRRHAVRERINSSEPIFDFRVQCVSDGIHVLDVEARNSNVEEQIERNGEKIDPCNAQCDSIRHPAIIEVGHIEDGSIGDEHESCNVEMRHKHIKPCRSECVLEQNNQIALNGINVRRHVKSCSSHQHSIDLVKPIFGIVDDKCNQ